MKKLLYILFAITLFTACSSDDDNEETPTVKTTFSIKTDGELYVGGIAAILTKDNKYVKVADVLLSGSSSKKYQLPSDTITKLYLFADADGLSNKYKYKFDTIFVLKKDILNEFILTNHTKRIVVPSDNSNQYPQ